MPHQCTNCGRGFPDGSKEMLAGCPDCGGNKFQFRPKGRTVSTGSTASAPSPDARSGGTADGRSGTNPDADPRSSTTADTRAGPTPDADPRSGTGSPPDADSDDDIVEPDSPVEAGPAEDHAQTDARTDVVSREELPDSPPPADRPAVDRSAGDRSAGDRSAVDRSAGEGPSPDPADDGPAVHPPEAGPPNDRPDIAELREELNDQFESIRVLNPGQYELNLMELYDREEHIISLREDGRYVIEVPESWRSADSG